MAYVRTVKSSSGATAVEIVHSFHRGSRKIEHLGSTRTPEEVEALKAAAKQRLEQGQAKTRCPTTYATHSPRSTDDVRTSLSLVRSYASTMSSSLELPARRLGDKPSKARRYALIAAAVVLPLTWIIWYLNTPPALSVSPKEISGTGVVGTPLYVGMFSAPSGFDRTLHISGVKVRTTANTELEVTPLLCRGATVGVTTQPKQFCKALVNPEGQEFTDGDSIVVRIESDQPAVAVIDRIRVGFRQDIRSATQDAGASRAIITLFTRS